MAARRLIDRPAGAASVRGRGSVAGKGVMSSDQLDRAICNANRCGALCLGVAIATAPALTWAQHGWRWWWRRRARFRAEVISEAAVAISEDRWRRPPGGPFRRRLRRAVFAAAPHYGVAGHYSVLRRSVFRGDGHGFTYSAAHYGGAHYVAHSGYVARGAPLRHTRREHPQPRGTGTVAIPGWAATGTGRIGRTPGTTPGWAWYLPVLPLGYATFWWGGVPYYYWNSLYYTWSPSG